MVRSAHEATLPSTLLVWTTAHRLEASSASERAWRLSRVPYDEAIQGRGLGKAHALRDVIQFRVRRLQQMQRRLQANLLHELHRRHAGRYRNSPTQCSLRHPEPRSQFIEADETPKFAASELLDSANKRVARRQMAWNDEPRLRGAMVDDLSSIGHPSKTSN